jgi:hypothetical protein
MSMILADQPSSDAVSAGRLVAGVRQVTTESRLPLTALLRQYARAAPVRNIDFMDAVVRTGGCLCGAVRYTVRGEPVHVRRCHCADCRKESGSAFTVYAQWPIEAFELTGDIRSYDGRGFCPRCGSRLLDLTDSGDSLIEIRIGTLDDAPFDLKPEAEIWVRRREVWIPPIEGAAQYEKNPR